MDAESKSLNWMIVDLLTPLLGRPAVVVNGMGNIHGTLRDVNLRDGFLAVTIEHRTTNHTPGAQPQMVICSTKDNPNLFDNSTFGGKTVAQLVRDRHHVTPRNPPGAVALLGQMVEFVKNWRADSKLNDNFCEALYARADGQLQKDNAIKIMTVLALNHED